MTKEQCVADVCRRIVQLQNANGGVPPQGKVAVTPEEYISIVYTISHYTTQPATRFDDPRVMGVPIEVGPVSYPWGTFPSDG